MSYIDIADKATLDSVKTETDKIGAATDTGGSATTGTLMGKVNKIIGDSAIKKWSAKYTSVSIPAGANTTTIINITGYGQLWDLYQTVDLKASTGNFNIIVDGTTVYTNPSATVITTGFILCRRGTNSLFAIFNPGGTGMPSQMFPLQFKESLEITVTTSSDQAAATTYVHYDLWE